jgi:hypothetical protein
VLSESAFLTPEATAFSSANANGALKSEAESRAREVYFMLVFIISNLNVLNLREFIF